MPEKDRGVKTGTFKEDAGIGQLMKIFEKANEAQRRGDWAGYGEHPKKLEEILGKLAR